MRLRPVKPPPKELQELLEGTDSDSKYYKKNIRIFNSRLAYASLQADTADFGKGVQVFKMHGESYHRIGNILPTAELKHDDDDEAAEGNEPKRSSKVNARFLALYFYDPE